MRIGVLANCGKPQAADVLRRLAEKAGACGIGLVSAGETAGRLPGARRVRIDRLASSIDLLMVLGGDGSLLNAVRGLRGAPIPVLGVNLGSLGFMTSVTEDRLEDAIDALVEGEYSVSERSLLDGRVSRGRRTLGRYTALNDVVIGWGTSSRMITLDVTVDGENVTGFSCDGLIVSTPTGSTGHSLSAGGPILHPGASAFVLSVVCPHTLSNRPLVVPDTSAIRVTVVGTGHKQILLSADGQEGQNLAQGDRIEIRRARHTARLVHLPGYSYFAVLRQKLHWRGSTVPLRDPDAGRSPKG